MEIQAIISGICSKYTMEFVNLKIMAVKVEHELRIYPLLCMNVKEMV